MFNLYEKLDENKNIYIVDENGIKFDVLEDARGVNSKFWIKEKNGQSYLFKLGTKKNDTTFNGGGIMVKL